MRLPILLVALCITGSARAITWNPAADWSDSSNPFGAWRLLQGPSSLFTNNWAQWVPGIDQRAWAAVQFPQIAHVPMWARTSIRNVYDLDLPMGTIFMHGAETERTGTDYSSLRWTSPITGTVYVCGATWMPRSIGRNMDSILVVNGTAVSQASLFGGIYTPENPLRFEDFSGGSDALTVNVVPGTTIDIVNRRTTSNEPGDFIAGVYGISTNPYGMHLMVNGLLQDYQGDPSAVPINIQIQNSSGTVIREATMHLSSESAIPILTCLEGEYTVCVKASHWLRQCQTVTFDEFGGSINFSLFNGDCDGDNEVSIGDYALLSTAYNSAPGDGNWDPNADLNGDDGVDIGDYAILSQNYGLVGD